MTVKSSKEADRTVRYDSLADLPRPKRRSRVSDSWSDEEIERRAAADADAGVLPAGFWDDSDIVEPKSAESKTIAVPRRPAG